MIGKAEITKEQANAIELYVERNDKATLLNAHAHFMGGEWMTEDYRAMNGLDQSDMARVLLIGYTVKPEYKIGDWIAVKWDDVGTEIYKVTNIDFYDVYIDADVGFAPVEIAQPATTEQIKEEVERRFWKSIGRGVGEFKVGDIYVDSNYASFTLAKNPKFQYNQVSIHEVSYWYAEGDFRALYTVATRKDYEVI